MRGRPSDQTRYPFSDPSGTNTPSEFKYSRKESSNGFMIVDFMLICLNLGYHDENWKARMESGVERGKTGSRWTAVGILAWETNREFSSDLWLYASKQPFVPRRSGMAGHGESTPGGWNQPTRGHRAEEKSRRSRQGSRRSVPVLGSVSSSSYLHSNLR